MSIWCSTAELFRRQDRLVVCCLVRLSRARSPSMLQDVKLTAFSHYSELAMVSTAYSKSVLY